MKLSEWARRNGVHYRTAKRYFDAGRIPGAYRVSERVILVPEEIAEDKSTPSSVAVYSRVSSNDQKDDLKRQTQILLDFATANGYCVTKVVEEIASGMNPRRKKLTALLKDPDVETVIVENRDRLARMNADLIIAASPKNILIAVDIEPENNDAQDIIDFMTSVCARQYGRRSARNRAVRETERLLCP